jgi:hypothetical protein
MLAVTDWHCRPCRTEARLCAGLLGAAHARRPGRLPRLVRLLASRTDPARFSGSHVFACCGRSAGRPGGCSAGTARTPASALGCLLSETGCPRTFATLRLARASAPIMDDGEFSSFWPPSYRAICALRWIVEEGAVTGLSFIHEETRDRFDGRYQ